MKRFQVCRLCGATLPPIPYPPQSSLHRRHRVEPLCNEKQPADLVIFSFLSFVRFLFKALGSVLKAMKTKFIST